MNTDYDILIVGAGLAGACAAALLAAHAGLPPARIALLAGELPPERPADAPPDLRVVALSRASERVLQAAGAWSRLPSARLCAYESMRVWHESIGPTAVGALCFEAAQIGEPNLGYIAEAGVLQRACVDSFSERGGTLIDTPLQTLAVEAGCVRVRLRDTRTLTTRLLVGADGARSLVRAQVPLAVRRIDFHQLALVATVRTELPHQHTAWQCFLHTGPLALLPLFDGSCSIVWSVDTPLARPLCDCSTGEFNTRLDRASGLALGHTALVSERRCFPLQGLAAHSYVAARCALIGDAAHVIHPLAGQGANLGLLDAAALCEAVGAAIARREDPGALRALRAYEQQRRTHNLIMDAAMRAFQRGFALQGSAAAWLINGALAAVNRSGALKRAFARQALGESGELPRHARMPVQ
jgi:2-octaprenylphenol hydroxylase